MDDSLRMKKIYVAAADVLAEQLTDMDHLRYLGWIISKCEYFSILKA